LPISKGRANRPFFAGAAPRMIFYKFQTAWE
jgi:hypothetical protein